MRIVFFILLTFSCLSFALLASLSFAVPVSIAKNYKLLEEKAGQGDIQVRFDLAKDLYLGLYTQPKIEDNIVPWIQEAAESGNFLAKAYLVPIYVEIGQVQEAERLFASIEKELVSKAVANSGDSVEAEFILGLIYERLAGNFELSAEWYTKAAAKGNPPAQNNLGHFYEHGLGLARDEKKAFELYKQSAIKGNSAAENNIGTSYSHGMGVEKDEAEAMVWYRRAAINGNSSAQNNLGYAYENGFGVEKSEEEAFKWYELAAKQRNIAAEYSLATCYEYGIGIGKDEKKALELYEITAAKGYSSAQNRLGFLYMFGEIVEKDEQKGLVLVRAAAEQGNAAAQYNLALCYLNGLGVANDKNKAVYWLTQAVNSDYEPAKETLEQLRHAEKPEKLE